VRLRFARVDTVLATLLIVLVALSFIVMFGALQRAGMLPRSRGDWARYVLTGAVGGVAGVLVLRALGL
jgi:hypothetical protein